VKYQKLFAILAVSAAGEAVLTTATAAELRAIRTAEHETVYIEVDTIAPRQGKPQVWTLWDHASEQINLFHEPYRSVRLLNEFDCAARSVRVLEIIEYKNSLGNGAATRTYEGRDTDPRPVAPGSVADQIWRDVCKTSATSSQESF
jgi:hypothetical protein